MFILGVTLSASNLCSDLASTAEALAVQRRLAAAPSDLSIREADAWQAAVACDARKEFLFNAGVAQQRVGRLDAALASYTRVLNAAGREMRGATSSNAAPRDRAVESKAAAMWKHTAFNRGLVLRKLSKYAAAVKSYDLALAVDPAIFDAWHNRGAALVLLHGEEQRADRGAARLEQALQSFKKATALNPAASASWSAMADIATRLGRIDTAVEALDGAYGALATYEDRRSHQAAQLLRKRGSALALLNRTEEAVQSFDAALACDGGERDAVTWMQRAETQRVAGRLAEATLSMRRTCFLDDGSIF